MFKWISYLISARFAKQFNSQVEANKEIVKRVKKFSDRSAYFICNIALVNWNNNEPIVFEGKADGEIVKNYNNEFSFGYDPIFYSLEAKNTFHNISKELKNKISHRAKACQLLITYLKNN